VLKVVIIEDDPDIGELLELHLRELPCQTTRFLDGLEGFEFVRQHQFDLLILDINLPGMDGMMICERLRSSKITTPIIMLTARTGEDDRVSGLEYGADDYLTKPFSMREFMARVKAVLRRTSQDTTPKRIGIIEYRQMVIDPGKRKVLLHGKNLDISPKEFDLILALAMHPGTTFTRKELLARVWGDDYSGYEHTVNSHINRLRNKIEKDPDNPEYVLTTWGIGYRFNDE
jgi:two-component system alkaline phosphatase synthesis response regulator PhoP